MINGKWKGLGSRSTEEIIKNNLSHTISKETVNIKQLSAMSAVIQILENIGCKWYFMFLSNDAMIHKDQSLNLKHDVDVEFADNLFQHVNRYKKHIVDEIAFTDYMSKLDLKQILQVTPEGSYYDSHPTPKVTAQYLSEIASKVIKIEDIDTIISLAKKVDNLIPRPKCYQSKVTEVTMAFLQSSPFKKTITK